jgi:hypothetical protein
MGAGQKADLEFHGGNAFFVRWRDPLFRENYGTHVNFETLGNSIGSLSTRINRDEFRATKDTVPWTPSWPGTQMAVMSGDPFASAPFVFRFRMPNGYWICPHTHPIRAGIRVISGAFLVGMGDALDTDRVRVLAAGDDIALEAGMAHFEGARGETVIEVRGDGPWGITFVDPRNDPSVPSGRGCEA